MDQLHLKFEEYNEDEAVIFNQKSFTYHDLMKYHNAIAEQLNRKMNEKSLESNNVVVIMMERSQRMLAAMWAALNQNITYVLVDVQMPKERVQYIMNDTKAKVVITEKKFIEFFQGEEIIFADEEFLQLQESCETILTDRGNRLAYILYTSGSSGNPKGVKITRANLISFIHAVPKEINFLKNGRITSFTSISFDIFFLESILSLKQGMTIILANESEKANPRSICSLISKYNAELVQFTPSAMQMIINNEESLSSFSGVKSIMVGGERVPQALLNYLQKKVKAKIFNMYGPTETTIWVTIGDLTEEEEVHIGKALEGTTVHILDDNLQEVPDGEKGEIYIAGEQVGDGYINRDDLTKEHFFILPSKNILVYRTGDYGFKKQGKIYCLGRIDNQVKVNGHRIEVEEIENVIKLVDGVSQALVTVDESKGHKEIIAFYTQNETVSEEQIVEELQKKVPGYMVPAYFYPVESFEYTLNDKIDRKASIKKLEVFLQQQNNLNELDGTNSEQIVEDNPFAKQIITIISQIGGCPASSINGDSKLSSIHIDSVTFIKLVVVLETMLQVKFDTKMMKVSNFVTVNELINYVKKL